MCQRAIFHGQEAKITGVADSLLTRGYSGEWRKYKNFSPKIFMLLTKYSSPHEWMESE
jgi:hypothetical protein